MKQDEQPELWEAHFCGGPSPNGERTVRVVGTLEQVVQELMDTLYWKSGSWTLAEIERIGPVRIAPSAESPSQPRSQVPTCITWSASWL